MPAVSSSSGEGGICLDEIIIIRAADPDGSVFRAVMEALHGKPTAVTEIVAPSITIGDIEIHPGSRTVYKAGKEVHLNHGEFSMLMLLASAPGQVFSKEQLYDAAWGEEYREGSTTAVENTIWRLRQKLENDPKHPVYIKTVIRSGYHIEVPE